jgi:uncharacterized lipoprotein YddW (UPF0748 family)
MTIIFPIMNICFNKSAITSGQSFWRKAGIVTLFFLFLCSIMFSQGHPKREMRAVWVATVKNIDWPSKPGLPVEDQKREMIELLNLVREYNMNTIVFQIRPAADAFYSSSLEPWSQWLTGIQGNAPDPFYDPLGFAISECRKRGIDIHVWLNPYRALVDTADTACPGHVTKIHPEWFVTYGKTVYFNPGLPEIRDHVAKVVADIVRRYDIDAIHMDDYFYPYRIAKVNFPDDSSFVKYSRGYSPEKKDDWRRENVDLIIKQLHDSIKSIKPWVEFGISPFGVWRNIENDPSGSLTKAGQTNYDDLFANILLWQKEGWIDYITPQIYWQIGKKVADYAILSDWWSHNAYGSRLYIGQAIYRINPKSVDKEWRTSREIIKQVKLNRTFPNIGGSMFFSAKHLRTNPLNVEHKLLKDLYRYPSLPASNNRIVQVVPDSPAGMKISESDGMINLAWQKGSNVKNFIIYRFMKGKPATTERAENIFRVTSDTNISIPAGSAKERSRYYYVITSQSYTNTESEPEYFYETENRLK